jgi:hypothetical protein
MVWSDKLRPFARSNGMGSGGYRARLQSERRWEERSRGPWLAMEMMVKILSDADSRQPCAREHRVVNGDHLQGMMVWFEEDTERD